MSQALTPQCSCPCCKLLSHEEKQRRAIFAPGYPLDKVLDFYDARLNSYVSTSDEDSISSFAPLSQVEGLETELHLAGGLPGNLYVSSHHPTPPIDWCTCACSARNNSESGKHQIVPEPLAPLPPDDLAGRFSAPHSGHNDPVWSRFPAVMTYLAGAAVDPLKLRAPTSTYMRSSQR